MYSSGVFNLLREVYLSWPEMIKSVLEKWGIHRVDGVFDEVVVVGMGGSGIVGDYLQVLAAERGPLPVYVVKSYILPRYVDKDSLVLLISYSGNTLETLLAFKRAVMSKLRVVVVSSGGILGEEARRRGVLHVEVPGGIVPRASLPLMLYSVLGLLDTSGYSIVTLREAEESAVFLEEVKSSVFEFSNELAKWLYSECVVPGKLVVVATHTPMDVLALRFKNELNENSKLHVKVDVAPEWMHNDIVGCEAPLHRDYCVIEIVDLGDVAGHKLVEFMRSIYSELTNSFYRVELRGENFLEKLLYGSLVGGLTSTLLAELRGLDPLTTRTIQLYKSRVLNIFQSSEVF